MLSIKTWKPSERGHRIVFALFRASKPSEYWKPRASAAGHRHPQCVGCPKTLFFTGALYHLDRFGRKIDSRIGDGLNVRSAPVCGETSSAATWLCSAMLGSSETQVCVFPAIKQRICTEKAQSRRQEKGAKTWGILARLSGRTYSRRFSVMIRAKSKAAFGRWSLGLIKVLPYLAGEA